MKNKIIAASFILNFIRLIVIKIQFVIAGSDNFER